MLQRVEAEIRHVGRFGVAEDAEDAALFFEFVVHRSPGGLSPPLQLAAICHPFREMPLIASDHARSASAMRHVDRRSSPPTAMRSARPPVLPDDPRRHAGRGRPPNHFRDGLRRRGDDDARGRLAEERRRPIDRGCAEPR